MRNPQQPFNHAYMHTTSNAPLPAQRSAASFLTHSPRIASLTGDPASFFKTLVEHEITVELKNEVQIRGTLKSVDQYLNIKLDNAEAVDEVRWPHLVRQIPHQEIHARASLVI